MILYDREHAIQRMNTLAKEGKDFIFIINYKADGAYVEEYADINPHELLFAFPSLSNIPEGESYSNEAVEWHTEPLTRDDYEHRINLVKQREREGDSYLANLTCKIPVHTNLSLHDIFMRSKALYRCWMKEKFVCFSPEIFVRINREGLIETPKRVAKMYEEILSTKNVDDFENYKLFDVDLGDSQEMVLVKEIPFFSMCEHHMLPFFGKVHVAYIPQDNRVIGLSKIPRLVEFVSRKLSVQEEITVNVAKKLIEILNPLGVAVVVEARHMCIEMRGVNKIGSVTRTSFYSGEFKENADRKREFLDGIRDGKF